MTGVATQDRSGPPARGLVAVGDSITRGSGEAMLGLRMQSWALWLAEALTLPFTCLAVDGARVGDALVHQLPRLSGPYDLGCVYLGVNDVRSPDWRLERYRDQLADVVGAVAEQSRAQLLVKLPPTLGRPAAPPEAIAAANSTIELIATRHAAVVVELQSLRGAELVLPDAVHPTARGQAHIALLATRRLAAQTTALDDRDIREALAPLDLTARWRYACGAGAIAQLRDWRRRTAEQLGRWVATR